MKKLFSFLLFLFLFVIILSNKQKQKINENETDIADTDSDIIDLEDTDFYEDETSLPVEVYDDNSPVTAPESANAVAANALVNMDKPVSVTPKNKNMKNAQIHLMKIYNFNSTTSEKMAFNALFYFFGKPIARIIIFRLRVNDQQERLAYSARTDCF